MTTISTASWAMPNYSYGRNTFNSCVSPMPNSAFGYGFAPIGTGTSSETYEQALARQRREEEAEFQRTKRENEAREAQAEQERLVAEAQREASDIFPELTAEEEEILLKYLEKVSAEKGATLGDNFKSAAIGGGLTVGVAAGCKTIAGTANVVGYTAACAAEAVGNSTSSGAKVVTATAEKTFNAATATSSAMSTAAKTALKWAGPVVEAGVVVYEDSEDISYAWKHGSSSDKAKQIGQTTVKAGAAAGGFWAGASLGAKAGAAIGTCICPGIGTAIGGFIGGLVGGIAGAFIGKWGARKAVGENVGARLKREQMAKEAQERAAAEQAEKMESYNTMLMDALTYAQTDEELDEATLAVLAKLQCRFAEQAPPAEQSAQAAA